MNYMKYQQIFIFLAVVTAVLASRTLKKVVLTDPDALCLDGTPGAYYILEGK